MPDSDASLALIPFLQYTFRATVALAVIMNPLYVMPAFLAATSRYSREDRERLALRAIRYAFFILILFLAAGEAILFVFGISIGAFQVAGGILIFLIGVRMFFAPSSNAEERREGLIEAEHEKEDIALVPLAMPIIAGPGTITTVMVLKSSAPGWGYQLGVAIGVFVACAIVYLAFRNPAGITDRLGTLGLGATTKLMALVLIAVSVQICSSGAEALLAARSGP